MYNQYSQALVIPQSKVDLTAPVNEFAHKVKEWDQRREGMDIAVRHLLQRHLPDWVRPQRGEAPPLCQRGAAAAPEAGGAAAAPAAAAQAQLIGAKRPSEGGEGAEAAAAAKRQQTGALSAAAAAGAESRVSAAAAANGTAGPPSRGNSDVQVAELQRQQEVDVAAALLAASSALHAPLAMALLCCGQLAACPWLHGRFAPVALSMQSHAHLPCPSGSRAAGPTGDSSRCSRDGLRAESRVSGGLTGGSGGHRRLDGAAV